LDERFSFLALQGSLDKRSIGGQEDMDLLEDGSALSRRRKKAPSTLHHEMGEG
jgi:hypothetical protein